MHGEGRRMDLTVAIFEVQVKPGLIGAVMIEALEDDLVKGVDGESVQAEAGLDPRFARTTYLVVVISQDCVLFTYLYYEGNRPVLHEL